jgi:hypothetical protein
MKKTFLLGIGIVLLFVSMAWCGSGLTVKEGQWEMTIETEMTGMPIKMPPTTYSQCITASDPVPQSQQPGQQCVVKDTVTKGNTVTWTVECDTPGGKSMGQGKVTYSDDTMEGTMNMTTQGMTITSKFKGRYLGPCNK